ncbi:hypothetical protein DTO164E3_3029 [Paecilomyces variotii]|uniref:Tat pathway signal sequence n=1 Tax=Byssochlamys spectabilis TaxID=264951 RepID=A0A443I0Z2_BYSSP|nr:hypothetical protein C8Q69DRAFT_504391 [Paecilomyces variotii]KAJ9200322.1 hypothetical protein DTO032I3_4628 [Paecilomyces variotii]KAJ9202589.1 hypothetical protein DTO164E3_3029 [Paecilomyces variotii]KAJ9248632.1 hypothetical protein DTO207G8_7268 [Paecilomyces variotii]KAJ9268865.1 hypothetical protein DTO212C5_5066 [Paecilomyces variotii]KAJ9283045.1 hypothetical protein DTO021D3_382 [Paecilomyces variotii]
MSTEEQRPFLDGASEDQSLKGSHLARSERNRNRVIAVSLFFNAVLLVVCVLLSVTVLSLSSFNIQNASRRQVADPYSPANDIIEYEYRAMIPNDTRFTGPPGPEWEQSMHELMEGTLLRISDDELKQSGSDSIPLKDGGYAAGLGVAHSLHCVKNIKQFLYHEHFYPDLDPTGGQFEYLRSHADHCLDFLRQGSMCHADYSMYTVYWGERRQDIPTHHVPKVQKCVNWDKLHKWMLDRAASTDMLVGP